MKARTLWAWFWIALGVLYFFVPLYGTLDFSLRALKDQLSVDAYQRVLADPRFARTFGYSLVMSLWTIATSLLIIVPTAYWVHLRLPRLRPLVEFFTLVPFVVPAIVLVFGMLRIYSRPPLALTESDTGTDFLLIAGYVTLSLPYMYRAVDTGLRAMDVRTLTEAAQSLGAGWPTILLRVIIPNLRVALLSGAFLTFTTVIGEFTFATFLARPAFGPYMGLLGQTRAYEPAALAIISLILTWASVGLIQVVGRGAPRQGQLAGAR
ncbi:MAG: ABC transporter permease [Chloroflexi bacterium]|nr:ABC transporter permease [Chloroflexota bacterium]